MADKASAEELKACANTLADDLDADIFLFNYEILPPVDFAFMGAVASRERRKNVILILVTEGGNADSAFRMMRFLQSSYQRVTALVPGWCKSAGTLMAIGAHELLMGNLGELGPLDVQIVKADEMDEQKSGLVAEAAFEKMQQEAYKFFIGFVRDIGASEYRVTLKTASDIAAKLTIGVVQPIFDKLEPVTIGEDFRSNRLAQAYAERLNMHSKNLRRDRQLDALENLLSGYPSHGFVIDFKEAQALFRNVKPLSDKMVELISLVGLDAMMPRSRRQEQNPKIEYLNDPILEPADDGKQTTEAEGASGGNRTRRRGKGAGLVSGNSPERGRTKQARAASKAKGSNGLAGDGKLTLDA